MPIFEYQCESCGMAFDVIDRVGLEERECRECGGAARRRISVPAPPVIKGFGGGFEKHVKRSRFDWDPNKSLSPEGKEMWRRGGSVKTFELDRGKLEAKAGLVGE